MDQSYWTPENFEKLAVAENLQDLLVIAIDILKRMPQPVILVCGPISTGGFGNVEANLRAFESTIHAKQKAGKSVFNQLPFEEKFAKFSQEAKMAYFTPVLDEFFLPIIKSGYIAEMHFMKDWQSSTGARWEHTTANELGVTIHEM